MEWRSLCDPAAHNGELDYDTLSFFCLIVSSNIRPTACNLKFLCVSHLIVRHVRIFFQVDIAKWGDVPMTDGVSTSTMLADTLYANVRTKLEEETK